MHNIGDRGSPRRRPRQLNLVSPGTPLTIVLMDEVANRPQIHVIHRVPKPISLRTSTRNGHWIESKAFDTSNLRITKGFFNACNLRTVHWTNMKLSCRDRPRTNAHWCFSRASTPTRGQSLNLVALNLTSLNLVHLELSFSHDEVLKVSKAMPPDKAPEPGGFTWLFYTSCWSIIMEDLTRALDSLCRGDMRGLLLTRLWSRCCQRKREPWIWRTSGRSIWYMELSIFFYKILSLPACGGHIGYYESKQKE